MNCFFLLSTSPTNDDDGTCEPTNPDSYSLQSPTTNFGSGSSTNAQAIATPSGSSGDSSGVWTSSCCESALTFAPL